MSSLVSVVYPPPPYDYGSIVEWTTGEGEVLIGEICGFDLKRGTATVEVADGSDFEVALTALRLSK